MPSIDEIIKSEVNPFDTTTFRAGNFWGEKQDSAMTVDSIHTDAIASVENTLNVVTKDHRSRTILLTGDPGSGKSYLLARLKRSLNSKAFFAYIGPWPDSEYIWRHILRYTVDSLTHAPEGQKDSQLMLWLKGLAAFKQLSVKEVLFNEDIWNLLRSDRQKFIKKLKDTYKSTGIYNADIFFGMLYSLTDPELYDLACEWLRGDELSEESLQLLKVKSCINSEDAAKNILENFGKISAETQPIVLCFDNLDNIPRLPDGFQDIQALFNVNTTIHNECLQNFLVILSFVTNNLRRNYDRIQQADRARTDVKIQLKNITLSQVESLWINRLHPIHNQATPQPESPLFPLTRKILDDKFTGGKTDPRTALMLGRQEYQNYKNQLVSEPPISPLPPDKTAHPISPPDQTEEFKLLWQNEFNKAKLKINKITLISSPELIKMLQEALAALEIKEIKPKLLKGASAIYSFSYKNPTPPGRIGVLWTEDLNMKSFYNAMNACKAAIEQNLCQTMYLIRIVDVGNAKLAGYKIYKQIFTGSPHRHITPKLLSVHYLAAYHNLVNAALAQELVVAGKTINQHELENLIRECKILHKCILLQDLGIVPANTDNGETEEIKLNLQEVKEFLFNLVKTQNFLGKATLVKNALAKFTQVNQYQVEQLINQLCAESKIRIVKQSNKPTEDLVFLIVK